MKKQWGQFFLAGLSVLGLLAGCGRENGSAEIPGSQPEDIWTEDTQPVKERRYQPVNPEEVAEGLVNPERPEFEKEDIRGISVVEDGQILYQINYTPQADRDSYLYWDMVVPYASTAVVNTEALYRLYETAAGLDLTAASVPEDEADAPVDLSDSDTYITLNYYNNGDGSEQESEPNETVTLLIGDEKDGQYLCSLKGYEDEHIMLDRSVIDAILHQDPYDLILKIPYVVNMATVQEIHISYQGKAYQMTLEGETYQIQGKEVEMEKYRELYSELMQPMLDGKIPEKEKLEESREPLISIDYIRNMDEADDYIIRIYPYEGGKYTVSVNGEEHFFLVPEDVEILEAALKDAF